MIGDCEWCGESQLDQLHTKPFDCLMIRNMQVIKQREAMRSQIGVAEQERDESRREHLHTQEQLNKLKQEYENLKCQKQLKST